MGKAKTKSVPKAPGRGRGQGPGKGAGQGKGVGGGAKGKGENPQSYWWRSQRPLASLVMLMPLLAIYELGLLTYARQYDIVARTDLRRIGEWVGLNLSVGLGDLQVSFLPALIVVGLLLGQHLVRRDRWELQPSLYCKMGIESLVLALPLSVLMHLGQRLLPAYAASLSGAAAAGGAGAAGGAAAAAGHGAISWQAEMIFSIGAGIYEEMLFRVIAIALLHLLLVNWLKLPDVWGAVGAVAGSAILFALYHFPNFHDLTAGRFILYLLAGVYLAVVYVLRGLGIAAGTHALYDVMVALSRLGVG